MLYKNLLLAVISLCLFVNSSKAQLGGGEIFLSLSGQYTFSDRPNSFISAPPNKSLALQVAAGYMITKSWGLYGFYGNTEEQLLSLHIAGLSNRFFVPKNKHLGFFLDLGAAYVSSNESYSSYMFTRNRKGYNISFVPSLAWFPLPVLAVEFSLGYISYSNLGIKNGNNREAVFDVVFNNPKIGFSWFFNRKTAE